jgi:dUTP pyrophosphatase
MTIKIQKLRDDAVIPQRAHPTDAGLDLVTPDSFALLVGERKVAKLGFAIALPEGYEAQVRSRSGLAFNLGVVVLNSPGTIDSNYRGEIGVILVNHGQEPVNFQRGDKIAQMVIARIELANFLEVDALNNTDRGTGGFGSTGVKSNA